MRFVLVFLAACAGSQEPAPKPVATATASSATPTATPIVASPCEEDTDCVVTDFGSCCEACPTSPHATARRDLEREKRKCAEVECADRAARVRCEPNDSPVRYKAVCRNRACAMEPK